jgi:hypothetical protein
MLIGKKLMSVSLSLFRTLNGTEAIICKYWKNASDGYVMIFKYSAK